MSCEGHRPALRAVALGKAVSPYLEEHLAVCPSCVGLVEYDRRLLRRIESGTEQLLSVEASPAFVDGVRARLEESEQVASVWAHRWLFPFAVGACALLATASLVGRAPSRLAQEAGVPSITVGNETARVVVAPPADADPTTPSSPANAPKAERTMATPAVLTPAAAAASSSGLAPSAAPMPLPSAARRVAPEILIPAGDVEAVRHFVAGRHRWRLVDESPHFREVEALEALPVADWEMATSESSVVFDWELKAWPLVPSNPRAFVLPDSRSAALTTKN